MTYGSSTSTSASTGSDHRSVVTSRPLRSIDTAQLVDPVGLALAIALALWVGLVAGGGADADGARPAPATALVVASAAAVVLGRLVGTWRPPVVPAAVAIGVAAVLVTALPDLSETLGRPLGYANANATLASLGVIAACGAAFSMPAGPRRGDPGRWRSGRGRRTWLVLAAGLLPLVLVPTSAAAALCLVAATLLVGLAAWRRQARLAVAGGAVVVAVTLGTTVVIALGADPAELGTRSEARGELWAGAVELVREEPWRGIGPGTFAELNPVSDDADLRWAHHGYLQAAAELGLPGLALGLAILVWAYGRLWISGQARAVRAVVGAAAVTVLALHATVDYVLHFPALPLIVAVLFGWATARPPGSHLSLKGGYSSVSSR